MFFVFLLLLTGCAHNNQWAFNQIKNASAEFNSSRTLYVSKDRIQGIDLEFIEQNPLSFFYLQVHGEPLKTNQVLLIIDNEKEIFTGDCHQGGQRLSVPEEIKNKIIQALESHKRIALQIEGYREIIESNTKQNSLLKVFGLY